MSKNNFIIAQTIKEFNFILSKIKKGDKLICIPLNYELMLYCESIGFSLINPSNYFKNDYHKKTILNVLKILNGLKLDQKSDYNITSEIIALMRFRLNSFFYLKKILMTLKHDKKNKFFFSGWSDIHPKSLDSYYISDIARLFSKEININFLSNFKIKSNERVNFLLSKKKIIDKKRKNIILPNIAYNFVRLILFSKRKYNFIVLNSKINFFKYLILKLFNTQFYNFKTEKYNFKEENFKFSFQANDKKIEKYIILEMKKFKIYFENLFQFQKTVKKFFQIYQPDLVVTNIIRGKEGSYNCLAEENKIPTLCIPHGTLSPYYNKYDKLYKKYISEAVFYKNANYYGVQSKICAEFLNQQKLNKKKFLYGNMIFSEKKNFESGEYFLQSSTLKDCYNSVLYGCEYFFEFDKNLYFLNEIAKVENIKIVVKIHPNQQHCQKYLVNKYKFLIFSNSKINKLLKKAKATISFSSTVIEDSLISKVPVILLDLHNRYNHFRVKKNLSSVPLFYVKNTSNLKKVFKKIDKIKNFKFNMFNYSKSYKSNINNNLDKIFK